MVLVWFFGFTAASGSPEGTILEVKAPQGRYRVHWISVFTNKTLSVVSCEGLEHAF